MSLDLNKHYDFHRMIFVLLSIYYLPCINDGYNLKPVHRVFFIFSLIFHIFSQKNILHQSCNGSMLCVLDRRPGVILAWIKKKPETFISLTKQRQIISGQIFTLMSQKQIVIGMQKSPQNNTTYKTNKNLQNTNLRLSNSNSSKNRNVTFQY